MYNIERVYRSGYQMIKRECLNTSPMHKRAAISYARIQAKKLKIPYDSGTWKKYMSTKGPMGDTVELNEIANAERLVSNPVPRILGWIG